MKNEITLYRPDELTEHIEVGLEDETVLILLAKRNKKVTATIYTKSINIAYYNQKKLHRNMVFGCKYN